MVGGLIWEVCDAAIPSAAAIRDAVRKTVASKSVVRTEQWTFTPIESDGGEVSNVVATVLR
jgi:hypothetical protein